MRCACIDIGSNTSRLLVADVRPEGLAPVLERRAFTRIGADLAAAGALSEAKLEEVATVAAAQAALAARAGAARVRTVATAAIRAAANASALCDRLRERAGLEMEVIAPDAEARLAFLGATRTAARALAEPVAVVDVGGGSTEVAVGTRAGGVTWSASVRLGSGLLADAHLHDDPPTPAQLDAAARRARELLAGMAVPAARAALAVGGSAASLRRLVGGELGPESLERAIAVLAAAPSADVARGLDLAPERVRLLPAGILVLGAVSERLGRPLEVGCGGLREGVCLELGGVGP